MTITPSRLSVYISVAFAAFAAMSAFGSELSKQQIIEDGERMADAQLAALAGKPPPIDWVGGVMWAGYAEFSHVSTRQACLDALEDMGNKVLWTPKLNPKNPFNADDICIGQAFLDVYKRKADPAMLAPLKSRMDTICDHINNDEPPDQQTWWWCDALFMAPPVHARLSALTGDRKYLDTMNKEYWKTTGFLYDKDEHLYFRDKNFFTKRTKNGKKVFWTRGNGWVFAGLARTLPYIPGDYPSRPQYIGIFQQMAEKLASLQQPDGTWRPSLLDPDEIPDPETSGTALDCYAFSWGINNGLLDRTKYLPVVAKAWAALLAARRPDGLLGYVEVIADSPHPVSADATQLYATGAFLMSACELVKLAPFEIPPAPELKIPPPAP